VYEIIFKLVLTWHFCTMCRGGGYCFRTQCDTYACIVLLFGCSENNER